MSGTDLTVSALVESDGRFLIVEESVGGQRVLNQPGGHIEPGETPEQAARREVLEESGCEVEIRDLIGAYMWHDEDSDREYLRIVFVADLVRENAGGKLDDGIHAVHWCSYTELATHRDVLRSRSVMRCVDDYLAGARQPRRLFSNAVVPEEQLDMALASAELIPA